MYDYWLGYYKAKGYSDINAEKSAKMFSKRGLGRIQSNWFAVAFNKKNLASYNVQHWGISISNIWGSDPVKFYQSLKTNVTTKYHPPCMDTVEGVATHEVGHIVDYKYGIRRDPRIINLWNDNHSQGKLWMTNQLSGYANDSMAEMIAEGWAEYRLDPNPRTVASQIGSIMQEYIDREKGLIP